MKKAGAFVIRFYKRKKIEGVNEGVSILLNFIKNNPGKRTNEIADSINKPAKTVERWLGKLKETNKIEYRGSSKTGGYYLL